MDRPETFRLIGVGDVEPATLEWLAGELPKLLKGARVEVERARAEKGDAGPIDLSRLYDRQRQQF